MIGRKSLRLKDIKKPLKLKGFDDFEVTLGDAMRGERATRGKSLMDVQHDLRIKAAYIAGVEDCDPSVFDTPGFIAGYVRSYAKYLGMDPDAAFDMFCNESGFESIHGMSARALPTRLSREERLAASNTRVGPPGPSPARPHFCRRRKVFSTGSMCGRLYHQCRADAVAGWAGVWGLFCGARNPARADGPGGTGPIGGL